LGQIFLMQSDKKWWRC